MAEARALPSSVQTIPAMLAWWAEQTPEAIALLALDFAPLDYQSLRREVVGLAERLRGLGVGHEDVVLIVMPDSPDLAVMILAGATAGIAAPLQWTMTRHEYQAAMAHDRVRAVVVPTAARSPAREAATDCGLPVIELCSPALAGGERFQLLGEGIAPPAPPREAQPADIALIIHSSGTTGRPKRVPRTHGNILASARNNRANLAITRHDRCLNLAPIAFGQGSNALFTALGAGAAQFTLPHFDLGLLRETIRSYRPTLLGTAPTVIRAIALDEATCEALRRTPPRVIRIGAGAIPAGEIRAIESSLRTTVIHTYGMSEVSTVASERFQAFQRKPGSVGLPNHELTVVDTAGRPLPPGETGEVAVRGPHVFPGYLDDPEANANAFLPGGWFRTGDLGRLDEDGYLFLTGRRKEMINRGGMTIVPGEIEAALLSAPGVAEACVFGLPHPFLGEEVAAAVVLRPGANRSKRLLRAHVASQLSPAKVPHAIAFLDEIPKGPTGKPLRREVASMVRNVTSSREALSESPPAVDAG